MAPSDRPPLLAARGQDSTTENMASAGCFALLLSRRGAILGTVGLLLAPSRAAAFPAYHGRKRVLVVLAPSDQHSGLLRQRAWVSTSRTTLTDRDVVVVYVGGQDAVSDLGPQSGMSAGAIRSMLKTPEGSFRVLLLDKDGKSLLESSTPIPVSALISAIDRLPVRGEQARQKAP